jgi:hypothetical protein
MAIAGKNVRVIDRDQDLLDFGRAYLSAAFPNPERTGCPADEMLRLLSRQPLQADLSITDHVTCCSPCFTAYMAHLEHARAEAKESRQTLREIWIRRSLLASSIASVLAISGYLFFTKSHRVPRMPSQQELAATSKPGGAATAKYIPVLVDLSGAAPGRGMNGRTPMLRKQIVPASQFVDLTLYLPVGSEAQMYSLQLNSDRHTEWAATAPARLESGLLELRMRVDFSQIHPGLYDLVVVSKGLRLSAPVLVKSAPDK